MGIIREVISFNDKKNAVFNDYSVLTGLKAKYKYKEKKIRDTRKSCKLQVTTCRVLPSNPFLLREISVTTTSIYLHSLNLFTNHGNGRRILYYYYFTLWQNKSCYIFLLILYLHYSLHKHCIPSKNISSI